MQPGLRYPPAVKRSGFRVAAAVLAAAGLAGLAATDPAGIVAGAEDALARALFWPVVLAACARLAARALRSRLTGLPHLVWDGGAGLAVLIALLIATGLLPGGFEPNTLRVLLAVVVVAGAWAARRDPVRRLRGGEFPSLGGLLLVVVAIAGLFWDRVPPVFFDTRAYHFALPEAWLIAGRIAPETWSLHSWFPPGMPVLYGAGMAVGGERFANDANLLVGLLLVGSAFDAAGRLFGPRAGALAGLFAATLPLTVTALAVPAADLGHGAFVFGAIAALLLREREGRGGWLARAALAAAGAALTKYLGLLVPLGAGAAWLLARSRGRPAPAIRFAAPAVLLLLPWLAANAVVVGNPVAPVASGIFTTRGLEPGAAALFRGDARGGLPGWSDLRALGPGLVTGSEDDSRFYPSPAFGWLPVLLLPFGIAALRDDREMRRVLGWCAAVFAVWFLTYRWGRFLVADGALLCVALGGAVDGIARKARALRVLPAVAAGAAVVFSVPALAAAARFDGGAAVALGREGARAFVERAFPSVRLFQRANERLDPARDRVLLVGEMRSYGLAVPRCAPTGFNVHPLVAALRADPDPAAASRALRAQGFTYLIVDSGWVARSAAQYPSLAYFRDRPGALGGYLASLGDPVDVEGGVALFRIPE